MHRVREEFIVTVHVGEVKMYVVAVEALRKKVGETQEPSKLL
jgi:hypothetical protein